MGLGRNSANSKKFEGLAPPVKSAKLHEDALMLAGDTPSAIEIEDGLAQVKKSVNRQRFGRPQANICRSVAIHFERLWFYDLWKIRLRRGESLIHLVYVAQAFSSDHEPFCLKDAHIDHDQRRDRQPYLNKSQALAMMRDILHGYELRTGVKPKRVVVHKTSMYQPEEEDGFREGTKGIVPNCGPKRYGRAGVVLSVRSKVNPTCSPAVMCLGGTNSRGPISRHRFR